MCVNIRGQLASSPLVLCGTLGIESRLSGLLSHLARLARHRTLFCNISFPERTPQFQNTYGFHYLGFSRVLPPHCSIQQFILYEWVNSSGIYPQNSYSQHRIWAWAVLTPTRLNCSSPVRVLLSHACDPHFLSFAQWQGIHYFSVIALVAENPSAEKKEKDHLPCLILGKANREWRIKAMALQ